MDVELTLPGTPVALAPGVATRVPVELRNPYPSPLSVRLSVARGRAAAWASVEPAVLTLEPGAEGTAEVVLQPPADQPPSPSLVPFTVHAEQDGTGEPAGFATGLLTVALPIPVTGELTARAGRAHVFDLRLANDSDAGAAVRVAARLDPDTGTVTAEPSAVLLEPGAQVTVEVTARPKRPVLGTPKPYAVDVKVTDAYDPDRAPLLAVSGTGTRAPRVRNWVAGAIAVLLAAGATAAVFLSGVRLPLPGQPRTPRTPPAAAPGGVAPGAAAPGGAAPGATVPGGAAKVGRPYALIDVFPHRGADGGAAAAQAARDRLGTAGMPVRLVDSLTADVVQPVAAGGDATAGFWMLLQDGFATAEAAEAFCTRWRVVAPKCRVSG